MTTQRYWVVGGDYDCMGFSALRDGSGQLFGPYGSETEAKAAWRRVSEENRSRATARYSIASEQVFLPG